MAERTNLWDAIGVASYGLLNALIESLFFFISLAVLGLLISTKWSEDRRIALLSVLALILAFWAIEGQAYFIWGSYVPEPILRYVAASEHPLRILYAGVLLTVVSTITIPVYLALKSDRFLRLVQGFIERVSLLTILYLFFDFLALIIIIIRNV